MNTRIVPLLASALLVSAACAAAPSHFFITANVGLFNANPGESNTFAIGQAGLPFTYNVASGSQQKMSYGVGFGYRLAMGSAFYWQSSINYQHLGKFTVKGAVLGAQDMGYQYQAQSSAWILRNDFVYSSSDSNSLWHTLTPYAGVSLGYAQNKSNDFSSTAKEGGIDFTSGSQSNFAWGVDVGLAYHFAEHNSVAFELNYLNLGKGGALSSATGQSLQVGRITGLNMRLSYNYFFSM